MRFRRLMAVPAVIVMLLAACGDDDDDDGGAADTEEGGGGEDTGTVNVLNAMEPEEAEVVQGVVDELITAEADYEVEIEASGSFEEDFQIRAEGGTLDVALLPQPGAVADAVDQGAVSLEDMGFDIAELEATFGEYLLSLVEVDGEHYGLPSNINLKSMVWYPKDDFDAAGYAVPETFDDLLALSDQIVADGGTPWCVGFESEDATGWPATDWMEDIMLRTAGTEVYDQWVNHDIPFNDPSVENAAEIFGQVMFGEGYVLGGADQTPAIAFGDAPGPMFQDPPGCWLHRQATFINAFFPPEAEAGVDYDWFPFPPIDQEGTLFAGEFMVSFRDAPEVVAVRSGRRRGLVTCLAQHQRRARLLRQRHPRRRLGGPDGGDRDRHGSLRRLRSDAPCGGLRELLERDDDLHAAGTRVGHDRPGRDRVDLAVVVRERLAN
jgi:alpha-glucoside transport system substrate-binding protein